MGKDVTAKFAHMVEAFECDLVLAKEGKKNLAELDFSDKRLLEDVNLLEELSYRIRYGKLKIVEVEQNKEK